MKKEDIVFLDQLVRSMDDAEVALEKSFNSGDYSGFEKARGLILKLNEQMGVLLNK